MCPWVFVLSGCCSPINNQKPKPWCILTKIGQEHVQISTFKGLWNLEGLWAQRCALLKRDNAEGQKEQQTKRGKDTA